MANNKPKAASLFAVLKQKAGSLVLGDHRITAHAVVPVPDEVRDLACPESTPVAFFETAKQAESALSAMQAEWARQPK